MGFFEKIKNKLKENRQLLVFVRSATEYIPIKSKRFNRIKIALNNRTGNWGKSLELTELHVERYDSSPVVLIMLAKLRQLNGDTIGATYIFKNSSHHKEKIYFRLSLARYFYRMGNYELALYIYRNINVNRFDKTDVSNMIKMLAQLESALASYLYLIGLPVRVKRKVKNYSLLLISRVNLIVKRSVYGELLFNQSDFSGAIITEQTWICLLSAVESISDEYLENKKNTEKIALGICEILILDSFYGCSSKDFEKILENIYKILSLLMINIDSDIGKYMLECSKYIFTKTESAPVNFPQIEDSLELWQLLALERIFVFLGFLNFSYRLRERAELKAINNYIDNNEAGYNVAKNALSAAIEGNYDAEAETIIKKINSSKYSELAKNKLNHFYYMMNGDIKKSIHFYNALPISEEEKSFACFVKNKSIAVVAPAPTTEKNGEEIDSHSFVLRPGAFSHPENLSKEIYGSRTDIGSFNFYDLKSRKFIDLAVSDVTIKYILCKRTGSVADKKFALCPTVKQRNISYSQYSLNGILNHVPDIALYLISMGANVSVYSANFFMTKEAYLSSYRKPPSLHSLIVGGDNFIVGHSYFKRMHSLNIVKTDSEVKRVVNLTTKEYIKNMESIYRETIRKSITV